ncbi:MAG: RagB/SusD family nutrient uptake outer membrane protein [Balneolaceae bacterium]|nr:RagB/SusD family nutrient uptake outer membrane protein [Balneolaceae bacterium]
MCKRLSNIPKIGLILVLGVVMILASCTDLTDNVTDQVTSENFFQTPQEFISAMGDAYGPLSSFGGNSGFKNSNEVASDEGVFPQRGQDWFDGGVWLRQHRHTWRYDEPHLNGAWQTLFSGVNNANRLIFQFEQAVERGAADEQDAAAFISELKIMRAFYYYWLLDMFGNVPIITSFENAPEAPEQPSQDFQQGRQAVFDFVEQELLDNIDDVSTDVQSTYGRANKWVAHFVLAKLYLNAEVYTGTPRWDDALTHLNAIINSGNYSLAGNFRDNFVTNNSGSPEFIFAVPYDKVFLGGMNFHQASLHYGSQGTFQLESQPWNGFSTQEEFYLSFIDPQQNPGDLGTVIGADGQERQGTLDDRRNSFLVGPQFTAGGEPVTDDAVFSDFDDDGAQVVFTPAINELEPNACRQCGARIGKWDIELGASANLSNDYAIFRYADVLLMKAEALWRQDPSSQEALNLVNMVRNRANVDDFSQLTADNLLAERGREFFYEIWRRQDLIRFESNSGNATRFNDPWWEKDASESWRTVFPIPRDQLEANPNLVQHSHSNYQG